MKLTDFPNNLDKSYKITAVLPCRINSTRLLAKPLQPIGKYSILELLIEQLKKSKTNRYQIGNHLFTGRAVSWNTTYNASDYRKQFDTYKVIPTKISQSKRWGELNSMEIYDEQ